MVTKNYIKRISTILKETDNYDFDNVLDIGLGTGIASEYFLSKGKQVHATGFDIKNYELSEKILNNINIKENINLEDMKIYEDNYFDAVWCCNVLEHVQNVGLAMKELKRIVKPGGWLFLIVPPFKENISSGHISTGWNLLNLIYNLVIVGIDSREGKFISWWGCIIGFQKNIEIKKFPKLTFHKRDLKNLSKYFPVKVYNGRRMNFTKVNWKWRNYKPNIKEKIRDLILGRNYKYKFFEIRFI